MVIRKINSIVEKYGLKDHGCYRPIQIVKDEENHYGIEDSDGNVFLENEYDCITPLGLEMWLLCKNGLFGLMTLGDDELCEARDNKAIHRILNLFLLVFMILQPLSGILMSKHLYTFLPDFSVSALARNVHLLLAY